MRVRLGDVVSIVSKQVDPRLSQYASLPLINGENIESGTTRLLYRRMASEEAAISGKYLVETGDVVYSKLRPYLRKVVVASEPALCSADAYPIRPDLGVLDPRWLAWMLVSDRFTRYATAASARARMPKLNREQLFAFEFELPARKHQVRVATELSAQLNIVDVARSAAEIRIGRVEDIRIRVLRGLLPLPRQGPWPWVRLDAVAEFLDNERRPISASERASRIRGVHPSDLVPYYGANGQAGWIDGHLYDEPLVLLAEDGGAFGSPRTPIAYRIDGKAWVNNHAHVLRARRGINVDFLGYALSIRPDIGDVVSGSTRGKLSQSVAGAIPVQLPPVDVQRRIAGELRERLAAVDAVKGWIQAERQAIEALPAALLRRVFNDVPPQHGQINQRQSGSSQSAVVQARQAERSRC